MKALGIILASLALLFLLWIAFGVVWWQNNQEEVMKAVDQAVVEGQEIGRDSKDHECMQTYMDIMKDCKEMTCSIQNQVFLGACLEHSQPTDRFCSALPISQGLMAFAKWASKACLDQAIDNAHCAAGLQEVMHYCEKPL